MHHQSRSIYLRKFLAIATLQLIAIVFTSTARSQASASPAAAKAVPSANGAPPNSVESAHRLLTQGRDQDAIAILQKLVAQQPPAVGANRELGIVYYRMGKLMDAEARFAAATKQDPSDIESIQMRGLTLYRLGQSAEALPYLEHTRDWTGTTDIDPNYVLGRCYIDAHRYDDARSAFAAQFNLDPESGASYVLTAQMLLTLELPDPAVGVAQKALRLSPQIPMAHFVLGKIYLAKGDFKHALNEFEGERAVNPTYPALYQFLGDLYLRMDEKKKAQHALTQALSLDTSNTGSFILMGRLFLDNNDPQTAAGYLEHAEQMDPSNFITHYMLGQAYRKMGRLDDARRELGIVAKMHSEEIKSQQ